MRRILACLLLALLLLPLLTPLPSNAQVIVLDPANLSQQIIQYAQMILDYAQQIGQLIQLIEQVEMMIENLEQIEEMFSDNPARFLFELRRVMDRLRGIVYQADDLLVRYDLNYTLHASEDLPTQQADLNEETLRTYRTLLAGVQAAARQGEGSASRLSLLSDQLDSAQGNVQALQAVGALTTQVATETNRLAELNAMTANALTVRFSHEISARETARKTFLQWIDRGLSERPPARETFTVVPPDFPGN
ncbi:MAG: hypothetical protein ACOC92_00590 [bacterium]